MFDNRSGRGGAVDLTIVDTEGLHCDRGIGAEGLHCDRGIGAKRFHGQAVVCTERLHCDRGVGAGVNDDVRVGKAKTHSVLYLPINLSVKS